MSTEPMQDFRDGVREAVAIAGSQAELERRTGIPQQTISWLLLKADKISAEHAVAIDKATEGKVPKWSLRPDLFDQPPGVSREAAQVVA